MRHATTATGTMSLRVISLFCCAVEVITGHGSLMRVEHPRIYFAVVASLEIPATRKSCRRTWGRKIIGKHCGISMRPTDDDPYGPTSSLFYTYVQLGTCIVDIILMCNSREVMSMQTTCSCEPIGTRECRLTFHFSSFCEREIAVNCYDTRSPAINNHTVVNIESNLKLTLSALTGL